MLSSSPLSLFCTLFLCFALAIVVHNTFTVTISVRPATIFNRKLTLKTLQIPKNNPPPLPKDDPILFHLASHANPNPFLPKKIAFLFLTTTPLHFAPLWELFFNQTPASNQLFNVYIHADPTQPYDTPFSGVFFNRVIHSQPTQRHSPTLITAARRLLAHSLLHDPSNAMFALLSPSCIPLHSFNFTYQALIHSEKSFIEILKNEERSYERWAARGENAMLPEVELEEFRIGSQFWVLTRRHARLVVNEKRVWSKFNRSCVVREACYPEEHYFPTIIHMEDPRGAVSATLTHVDWTGSWDGHPRMYNASEVDEELILGMRRSKPKYGYDGINGSELAVTPQNDSFLFARKFSPESIGALLDIAKDVILKD